jgi:hypothetical protein
VTLDGGPPPYYAANRSGHPPTKPGPWAFFGPITPGERQIHIFDPSEREVLDPPPTVRVEAGAVTLLYVNVPLYFSL